MCEACKRSFKSKHGLDYHSTYCTALARSQELVAMEAGESKCHSAYSTEAGDNHMTIKATVVDVRGAPEVDVVNWDSTSSGIVIDLTSSEEDGREGNIEGALKSNVYVHHPHLPRPSGVEAVEADIENPLVIDLSR